MEVQEPQAPLMQVLGCQRAARARMSTVAVNQDVSWSRVERTATPLVKRGWPMVVKMLSPVQEPAAVQPHGWGARP